MEVVFEKYLDTADRVDPIKCIGRVVKVLGLLIESKGPAAIIGEICRIDVPRGISASGTGSIQAEVVGLHDEIVQLMAFEETSGIEIGNRVIATGTQLEVPVSRKLLGRVLDHLGRPIDDKGEVESAVLYPAVAQPPDPLRRKRVTERIITGVRAIDGLLAVGKGQRLGIFSGSGVGKSTLLGMIARNTNADVNVVALIGERGKEVNDFIERDLGKDGLARSVVVVTPGNSPPLARLRGAYVATAVAEYFRDQGMDVMLLFDSVTRFARAQREIGLSAGEPVATRGYPPSMSDTMQKLLERSGNAEHGSITGMYTVLVDGDDMDEPVADTARGILDGHIILDRSLAEAYHFPAINILKSVSRSAIEISGAVSRKAEGFIRKNMAAYAEVEDMINIGAYKSGSNPSVDTAIAHHQPIEDFLVQDINETASLTGTLSQMAKITGIAIPEDEMLDRDAHPHDAVPAPHGASGVSSQAGLHGAGASSSPLFAGRVFSGGGLASFPGNIDIIDSTGNSA